MNTERIREEIGRALDNVEPADRSSLLIWGSLAGVAVLALMVTAFAADAPPALTAVERIGTVEAAVAASQSSETTLEQRNAQLLHAIVVLSDDNDAMRLRVTELEQKLAELERIPEFGKRLARVEDDVAHLARSVPFGETAAITAPPLTAPAAILTPPIATTPPVAESVAAPPPSEAAEPVREAVEVASAASSSAGKNTDRLLPVTPEAENTDAPRFEPLEIIPTSADSSGSSVAGTDPIETASINPAAPVETGAAAEGDSVGSAATLPSGTDAQTSPLITEPVIAVAPIPERRPAQVATRTSFGVDLGSYGSLQMLESKWQVLAKKDPSLVKHLTPMVATRDGMMGNETHLIAGPFADAADAATACAKFKAIGAACRPTDFPGDRPL